MTFISGCRNGERPAAVSLSYTGDNMPVFMMEEAVDEQV
ncbi:hypothetical protein SAMN05443144_106120 [Fodinibius roseus]|uniref:Uncharacterized protein n=1 Tax=Fodinibius roseus TaxID=1194090 RepID=A0A1M4ZSQ6_9BACT|nr:hypothetical protein SAMN05443144_106120 [Fodinibius roseus]